MKPMSCAYDNEYFPSRLSPAEFEARSQMVGTKDDPYEDQLFGVKYHLDGVGVEAAPLRPFRSVEKMLMAEEDNRRRLEDLLGTPLVGVNVIDLRKYELHEVATPRLYASAHEFGCSPDFKRGSRRIVPKTVYDSPFRELGTHFHFDLPEQYWNNPQMCGAIAHEMDQATRVFYLAHLGEQPDGFRPWYRARGVYRPKPYGIEYRSFGSALINDSDMFRMVATIMWEICVEAHKSAGMEVFV